MSEAVDKYMAVRKNTLIAHSARLGQAYRTIKEMASPSFMNCIPTINSDEIERYSEIEKELKESIIHLKAAFDLIEIQQDILDIKLNETSEVFR